MEPTRTQKFDAYLVAFTNAFASDGGHVVKDVDYTVDYDKLGIHAKTDKGAKFIMFIQTVGLGK